MMASKSCRWDRRAACGHSFYLACVMLRSGDMVRQMIQGRQTSLSVGEIGESNHCHARMRVVILLSLHGFPTVVKR